jgi:hypothetical protein
MSYDNTNTGLLFINKNKKEDKHPFWKGKINVNGEEFELSAWQRDTKTGEPMLSLKLSEPFQKQENTNENIQNTSTGIPF